MALLLVVLLMATFPETVMAIPVGGNCTAELLALSPCLPYVASSPNNRSSSPSPLCCRPLRASAQICSGGNGCEACLCLLLRNSSLFGFPVNTARFVPLVSLCHLNGWKTKTPPNVYLHSLCRGSIATTPPPPPKSTSSGSSKNSTTSSGSSTNSTTSSGSSKNSTGVPTNITTFRNSSFRRSPGIAVPFLVLAAAFIIGSLTERSS